MYGHRADVPEGSQETTQQQETAPAPGPSTTAAAGGLSAPLLGFGAGSMLALQRSAGNRAAPDLAHRHLSRRTLQRAGGLLPPAKVASVYGYWLMSIAKARGIDLSDASVRVAKVEEVEQAAREKTKTQVGDLNFANWVRWESGAQAQAEAAGDAAHAQEVAAAKPPDLYAGLQGRHDAMWKETAKMRAEMVQTEYFCQKLNFGSGAKGTAARITAGGYTAVWGVGARTVSSVADHAPMIVLTTIGTGLGSTTAEKYLVKQGQAVKREGEEMGEDVGTATRLVSGDMQAAYQATRAPYAQWEAAFSAFTNASSQFLKDRSLDGIEGVSAMGKDIGAMEAAEKQMRDANDTYQIACEKLGIKSEAKALDTLGKHIVKGSEEAVSTAVTMALPEVAPSLAEIKSAVKGVEGLGAKELTREGEAAVAKALAENEAAKAAEGQTMKIGTELAEKSGMPVQNQQAIADACKAHDVVIDVRPTNVDAPARLAEGHIPKPEAIKAKTINELDTYLGFSKDSKGLVGYMEPKAPSKAEVPPELWEQVQARYQQRLAEFKDLAPDMKNLSLPPGARDTFAAVGFDKQVVVDSGGVVRVVEGNGKSGVGFTGDHDLFQITNPNGTPVSAEKYNEVVADLVGKQAGVEHGAHMHWDVPAKPMTGKDPTKGFQSIANQHMPSPSGGEDLFRFNPDGSVTKVRADAAKDTLAAARAAGKSDKAAAVKGVDIDKTVAAIGN